MKTKQDKQKEAIARHRASFDAHRLRWIACQPGGEIYDRMKKKHGRDEADKIQQQANKIFKKAQEQANVDSHGNPLEIINNTTLNIQRKDPPKNLNSPLKKSDVERARRNFSKVRTQWLSQQVGGEAYENMKKNHGFMAANRMREAADALFKSAQEEARVTSQGTPIEKLF